MAHIDETGPLPGGKESNYFERKTPLPKNEVIPLRMLIPP
jgi:hypothetical protein